MSQSLVLVLNCGSSSLKFAVMDAGSGESSLEGLAECLGNDDARIIWKLNGKKQQRDLGAGAMHDKALAELVTLIQDLGLDSELAAVGHRVVHGGERFTTSVRIDDAVLEGIRDNFSLAPLHNPANLMGIDAATAAFPSLPQVAVFDTAFHQTMPKHAYMYALPQKLYQQYGMRRYGMHGTSHYFVTQQAAEQLGKPVEQVNLVTAHLGNGASVCAVSNGQSMDTSMGMTPLEGLVMGTRSGDVDPSIRGFIAARGYTAEQIDAMLNNESGLLGLSGVSNDFRVIVQHMEEGHEGATLAFDVFCYRLAKYIASYMVAVGAPLDALVFTGGIGENSVPMRKRVLEHLSVFGYQVDDAANARAMLGNSGAVNAEGTPPVLVIPTNEEWVIASEAMRLSAD